MGGIIKNFHKIFSAVFSASLRTPIIVKSCIVSQNIIVSMNISFYFGKSLQMSKALPESGMKVSLLYSKMMIGAIRKFKKYISIFY